MVVDEFRKGNYIEVFKNVVLLIVGLLVLIGFIKIFFDFFNGKEVKVEDLLNRLFGNILGIFFIDRYLFSKFL